MPNVSVIIPVYGVEKYIERCARSLFEQSLEDMEYIFVNDCTPDKSVEILKTVLEEYPNRIPQTKIVQHVTNQGASAARHTGLMHATSDYITYCDSDDWVNKDAYKSCIDLAVSRNYDAVFFDYNNSDGVRIEHQKRAIPTDLEKLMSGLISGVVIGSLWGFIAKSNLYTNVTRYPKYNINEDLLVCVQLMYYAKSILRLFQIKFQLFSSVSVLRADVMFWIYLLRSLGCSAPAARLSPEKFFI